MKKGKSKRDYKKKNNKKTYKRNNRITYKRNNRKTYKRKNKKKTYKKNKQSGGAMSRRSHYPRTSYRYDPLYGSQGVTDDSIQPQLSVHIPPSYRIKNEFLIGSDGLTVCYQMENDLDGNIIYIRWSLLKDVIEELVSKYYRFARSNPLRILRLSNDYRKPNPRELNFLTKIKSRISELNKKLVLINSNPTYKKDFDKILQDKLSNSLSVNLCFQRTPYTPTTSLECAFPRREPDLKGFNFNGDIEYCICSMEIGYPVHTDEDDFHFFIAFVDNTNNNIITLGYNNSKTNSTKDKLGAYSILFPDQGELVYHDMGAYTSMDIYTSTYKINGIGELFSPFDFYNGLAFRNKGLFNRMLFTDWDSLTEEQNVAATELGLNKEYWNKKYWDYDRTIPLSVELVGVLSKNYDQLTDTDKENIKILTKYEAETGFYANILESEMIWNLKKKELSHPYTNGCKIRKVVDWKRLSPRQISFMNKIKTDSEELITSTSGKCNIYQIQYRLFEAHKSYSYPVYPWLQNHDEFKNRKEEKEIKDGLEIMKSQFEHVSEVDDLEAELERGSPWDNGNICKAQVEIFECCCLEGSILFHNLDNFLPEYYTDIMEKLGKELTPEELEELRDSSSSSDSDSDMEEVD